MSLQLTWNSVRCQSLIALPSGMGLLIYLMWWQNSSWRARHEWLFPEVLSHCVPAVQTTQPLVTAHKDSQNVGGHRGPTFLAVSLSKTLSCFVPFPPTMTSCCSMSLIIGWKKEVQGNFLLVVCWCGTGGSPWVWVLEYPLTSSVFVRMKHFWASSIAVLMGSLWWNLIQ